MDRVVAVTGLARPVCDPSELRDAEEGWAFVRHSRNVAVGNCNAALFALGFNQGGMRDLCFNLLMASAFAILEKVLQAAKAEGAFSARSNGLGALLAASRSAITWVDWQIVDEGRQARNRSIHEQVFLAHAECRQYIGAIEVELVSWGVVARASPELWHW